MKAQPGFLYYFTLAMTAVYAVLGIYIMLSESIESFLPGNKKYIIGALLIFYSAYRAYRIYRLRNS
jgi:hypothetical protein